MLNAFSCSGAEGAGKCGGGSGYHSGFGQSSSAGRYSATQPQLMVSFAGAFGSRGYIIFNCPPLSLKGWSKRTRWPSMMAWFSRGASLPLLRQTFQLARPNWSKYYCACACAPAL